MKQIKISVNSAKRLGFTIKGYVFTKNKKTPVPILERKTLNKRRKNKNNKEKIKLKKCGIVYKLDLSLKEKGD